jgi:two-component system, NarL family, nitrate/nitrite response regulator NarL
MPIRVLIADDATCIRNAVRDFLENTSEIHGCGEAENYFETLQLAASLKPDVILLDLHMPDASDYEPAFVKSMLGSTSQVFGMTLLTDEDDPSKLASDYGALAILDKAQLYEELISTIKRIRS